MPAPPARDPLGRLLRALYSAALYLLLPLTVYHLVWRGFRQRAYLLRWNERYGTYGATQVPAPLWLHAVSVGEVNAAAPLVDALRDAYPALRIVVTTITPTGSERVRGLWGDVIEHVYLPYDLPGAVDRFLGHFQPQVALILETELWPNLLHACRVRGIPSFVLNARLSARSLRGYQVLRPLVARALAGVDGVLAQSAADARRFVHLGARPEYVHALGNLKYDFTLPPQAVALAEACRARHGARRVWIAASTHEDEEAAMLAIHRRLRGQWPDLLLLWAPRHPERFRAVAQASRAAGFATGLRSETTWPDADTAVFVLDSLGELAGFYGCAEVAFVGGSLQAVGGHNLLEPAAAGVAVVTGPHLFNFAEIARALREADALCVGDDAEAVAGHIAGLLADPARRATMAAAGRQLVADGRGALTRTLALLAPVLERVRPVG